MHRSQRQDQLRASTTGLLDWYRRPLGQMLAKTERQSLDQLLPDLFGYHLLQLGDHGDPSLCAGTRISHRAILGNSHLHPIAAEADAARLPIANESVDVCVLPHTLEFHSDPYAILREVERVLIPEGHVVILGFNPWSLWGLMRVLLGWRHRMPWQGQYFSRARVTDWLNVLGFDMYLHQQLFFRPPIQHLPTMQKLAFFDKIGRFLPIGSAAYVLIATKRTSTLTPIKPRWRTKPSLANGSLVEPSTRGNINEEAG